MGLNLNCRTIMSTPHKSAVTTAVGNATGVAAKVGWAPLAGCAAVYLAHIRQVERQAGTTPRKAPVRHVGRDYER